MKNVFRLLSQVILRHVFDLWCDLHWQVIQIFFFLRKRRHWKKVLEEKWTQEEEERVSERVSLRVGSWKQKTKMEGWFVVGNEFVSTYYC